MPKHDHTSQILESILQELCTQPENPRSLRTLCREELKPLQVEEFPTDLQLPYKHLLNQLNQTFERSPYPGGKEDPDHFVPPSRESLIEDLLHLYARLQTHKTPYVNKDRFLDRLNASS